VDVGINIAEGSIVGGIVDVRLGATIIGIAVLVGTSVTVFTGVTVLTSPFVLATMGSNVSVETIIGSSAGAEICGGTDVVLGNTEPITIKHKQKHITDHIDNKITTGKLNILFLISSLLIFIYLLYTMNVNFFNMI
jgi:hypothetical protein